nr:G protein-coupled receptor [Proales similis]
MMAKAKFKKWKMIAAFLWLWLPNLLTVSSFRQPCPIIVYPAEQSSCNVDIICYYRSSENFDGFQIAPSSQNSQECLLQDFIFIQIKFIVGFESTASRLVKIDRWQDSLPLQQSTADLYFTLEFYAIKGISSSLAISSFLPATGKSEDSLDLNFHYTNVQLTDESGKPVLCSPKGEAVLSNTSIGFNKINFRYGNVYHENTCDQIFKNARINFLQFNDLIDSLIRRNRLTFVESEPRELLSSRIERIHFTGYGMQIDKRLISYSIFSQTVSLKVSGSMKSIMGDFLIGSELNEIEMDLSRLRHFLHNQFSWVEYANNRSSSWPLEIKLSQPKGKPSGTLDNRFYFSRIAEIYETVEQLDGKDDILLFDADFCVYYRLIDKKLNLKLTGLAFEEFASKRCTCIQFWMSKTFMSEPSDFNVYQGFEECERQKENMTRVCDFEQMASRCSISPVDDSFEAREAAYLGIFRLNYAQYVIGTLVGSVASLGAVLINCLVVFTFRGTRQSAEYRKNKRTDKNRRMWDYVYINTFFVLLQAVIYALGPLTACVQYDGVYCTPLYFTRFMQVFYLFVESYLGNAFKLMGNVTNTAFVLYRFAVNRDCWPRLRSTKPFRLVAFSFFFALLISSIRLFVNERFDIESLGTEIFEYSAHKQKSSLRLALSLKVVDLANVLLGNVVFTLVNFIVDLRLLLFLRSHDKANRKEEVESRITKMIVLNGLCSLLFRSPEIAISIMFLLFTFNYSIFPACVLVEEPTYSACFSLFKISKFFFSLTFYENFVLLYLFNQTFKKQLDSILASFKKKKFNHDSIGALELLTWPLSLLDFYSWIIQFCPRNIESLYLPFVL